jgi:hypothetical protein
MSLFGGGEAQQPAPQPAPTVAPAQPAPQPQAPSTPAPPAPQPQAPSTPAPAEDTTEDIEPELDPAQATSAASEAVLKSYQTALKKANNEARGLRTRVKELEQANATLTATTDALKAQVVPTQRELTFYHTIHEDGNNIGSVLYPQLLWQALTPHLQWNEANQPTNLQEALTKARAQFPALFKPVPSVNGGEGSGAGGGGGEAGFSMNNFIRRGITGRG